MKHLQHANKVESTYRRCRRGLNNLGKEKDRSKSRQRKRGKR